jgi:predicted regulator of Ras-like GTPase activity (Roadblock/LC7/MglB family)
MAGFREALEFVVEKVPETELVMVMGTDAIPIDRIVRRADANLEAVAAEYTTVLRSSLQAAADTGLGELQELCIVTERMAALLVSITPDYFVFAAIRPQALMGRARFALRVASLRLEHEFH